MRRYYKVSRGIKTLALLTSLSPKSPGQRLYASQGAQGLTLLDTRTGCRPGAGPAMGLRARSPARGLRRVNCASSDHAAHLWECPLVPRDRDTQGSVHRPVLLPGQHGLPTV